MSGSLQDEVEQFQRTRGTSAATTSMRIKRMIWSIVQGTLYRHSFHTWSGWRASLLRMFGATVGPGCTIRRTSRVYYPWRLRMGAMSCLGDQCVVYNLGSIDIGKRVIISQEAYLCAGSHDYRVQAMPLLTPPITLKDDCWVCARAFVGPGVVIGEGAIVGAAAVAMRNVEDWTIVAGNPAQVIKQRPKLQG